jgi:hypothetical protein
MAGHSTKDTSAMTRYKIKDSHFRTAITGKEVNTIDHFILMCCSMSFTTSLGGPTTSRTYGSNGDHPNYININGLQFVLGHHSHKLAVPFPLQIFQKCKVTLALRILPSNRYMPQRYPSPLGHPFSTDPLMILRFLWPFC